MLRASDAENNAVVIQTRDISGSYWALNLDYLIRESFSKASLSYSVCVTAEAIMHQMNTQWLGGLGLIESY